MSWSLDVYATRADLVPLAALQSRLQLSASSLYVAAPQPAAIAENSPQDNVSWRELHIADEATHSILGRVLAIPFSAESSADPELVPAFEREIEESDAEVHDEEFTSHLRDTLRRVSWHYSACVRQNGRPEQERAVVQTMHALSQLADGLVHDPQTGAWMDAGLFESLLAAYGVEDFA